MRCVSLAYTLLVRASYAGWQALHFRLPDEADLAWPFADADSDGLANLGEYAFRRNPRAPDAPAIGLPDFHANGDIVLRFAVRDDDPDRRITLEAAADITFTGARTANVAVSDLTPGDGLRTIEFTELVKVTEMLNQRHCRLRLSLVPGEGGSPTGGRAAQP